MKRISSVYFFPFLNTYKFQYMGRLGGKQFKRYLVFNWFISLILFCYGRVVFCRNWLEGTRYLLVQEFCSALFPEFLAPVSTHLVTPTAVPELTEKILFPISSDEEDLFFGFRPLANHLAPFFLLHLLLSCYSFGLL